MNETLKTAVTKIAPNVFGCRVISIKTNKPIVELQVAKSQISDAFYDMFRTLDKMGVESQMAQASRARQKGNCVDAKYIWY